MGRRVGCLFTVCNTGCICVLDPRRVTTRTDAAMTLQLYVTVVRRSQTGWIETTGLKKSVGSAWLAVIPQPPPTSLQALLSLLVLLLLLVVVVVEVEVTVV